MKLFNELVNASDEISATSGVENFKIGFRLGVLMMCDILGFDNGVIFVTNAVFSTYECEMAPIWQH